MKINIEPKRDGRIPNVGELWTHDPEGPDVEVFMRIKDSDGRKVHPGKENSFFSVSLSTGGIARTDYTERLESIFILTPVEGAVRLEVESVLSPDQ